MTDLASAILARLQERGWLQKTLAIEWNRTVGKKSPTTFESRLSKLLNDEEDGYAFVLDGADAPTQLAALASCLAWDVDQLRALCDAARRRPTLVLEPRLPTEQRAFFEKRAAMSPGTLKCVQLNGASGGTPRREALRDLAKRHRNAIVIVADDGDGDFLEGAGVRTSRVEPARPGFRVEALPDIFPQLAARTEDADGMKMFPEPNVEGRYRESFGRVRDGDRPGRWYERIMEADEEGTPVTFRLDWLLEEWGCRRPSPDTLAQVALKMATQGIDGTTDRGRSEAPRLDNVWIHDGRVLALCSPNWDHARRKAAEHVPVRDVTTFDPLVAALRKIMNGLNPYGEGGDFDLAAELDVFARETGLNLTFTVESVRKAVSALHKQGKIHEGVSVKHGAELDERVHALLDDLMAREVVLPESHATMIWTLEAARRAPLLHLGADDGRLTVLADIGTGHVLRLDIMQYKGEQPAPVRLWGDDNQNTMAGTLDAGNIRVIWTRLFDETLSGSLLLEVSRRRKAAAADAARRGDD